MKALYKTGWGLLLKLQNWNHGIRHQKAKTYFSFYGGPNGKTVNI